MPKRDDSPAQFVVSAPRAQQTGASGNEASEGIGEAIDHHRDALRHLFPVPPARTPRRKRAAVGGTVLVTLLAAGLWWLDPAYRSESFSTRIGERTDVELTDGSHLVLDTDTTLEVRWHLRSRRVSLNTGRAHFDIAHAGWRPFSVAAGAAQVRVVGTRFDVWKKKNDTEVAVYQGRVAVWRNGQHESEGIVLQPGQQTHVGSELAEVLFAQPLERNHDGAWKDGRLVFHNMPLAQAVAMIQRYHRQPIRITDTRIASLTLSGVFDSSNTEQLLDLLPGILPVSTQRLRDGSVELAAR